MWRPGRDRGVIVTISAPGKLFLFGEYAVLRGAPAIVTAVDRRVVATRTDAHEYTVIGQKADPVLPAAVARETNGDPNGLTVYLRGMMADEEKLGLGSSAASASVLAAALLGSEDPTIVYPAAYNAHRAFQGGLGSGADVAASCHGGTIVCRPNLSGGPPEVESLPWPDGLQLFAVWTGKSADTRKFIEAVDASQRPLPHLSRLAEAAVIAFRDGDVERLMVIASDYDDAMGKLGAAAGVGIRTRTQAKLSKIVRDFGATSKPSGAGGGDISLVFARSNLAPQTLSAALPKGTKLLNLRFNQPGLRRDAESD